MTTTLLSGSLAPPRVSKANGATAGIEFRMNVQVPWDQGNASIVGQHRPTHHTTLSDLYPVESLAPPHLHTALRLLGEGVKYLDDALSLHDEKDIVESDDRVQQLQQLLPELFCCRELGDGFAALILGIFHALQNQRGQPLTRDQVEGVRLALFRLREHPFMSLARAEEHLKAVDATEMNTFSERFSVIEEALRE